MPDWGKVADLWGLILPRHFDDMATNRQSESLADRRNVSFKQLWEPTQAHVRAHAARKKPVRTAIGGQVWMLKVDVYDSFGEDAFRVRIDPAPKLDPSAAPPFTKRQGQYLAFIYNYSKIHGRAPAESDLQRYFQTTPPAVHQMIKTLELSGFIERTPGQARSIRLVVRPEHLPTLG